MTRLAKESTPREQKFDGSIVGRPCLKARAGRC